MTARSGFTLVELLVAVALLTLLFSIAAVSLPSVFGAPAANDDWEAAVEASRISAIESGQPVVLMPDPELATHAVLVLPDGRAIGEGVDPLTGASLP